MSKSDDTPDAFSPEERKVLGSALEIDPGVIAFVRDENGAWVNQWGNKADPDLTIILDLEDRP